MMGCNDIQEMVELYVLGGLNAGQSRSVQSHLSVCEDCSLKADEYHALLLRIRSVPATEVSDDLASRCHTAVAAEINRTNNKFRLRRLVPWAAAAAVLITVSIFLLWEQKEDITHPVADSESEQHMILSFTDLEKWQYRGASSGRTSIADSVVAGKSHMYMLKNSENGSPVMAISVDTGMPYWQTDFSSIGYLVADDQHLFCLVSDKPSAIDLVSLDPDSGSVLWSHSCDTAPCQAGPGRPVILDKKHVCWINNTDIHMLDIKTGELLWARDIAGQGPPSCAATCSDGLCIVTCRGFHCLDVKTGEHLWNIDFKRPMCGHRRPLLAISGNRAYFRQYRIDSSSRLYCMDMKTRDILWQREIEQTTFLSATRKLVLLRGRHVEGIDSQTGQTIWTCAAEGCGPVTTSGKHVYFVDSGQRNHLVAVHIKTGKKIWSMPGIQSCDGFARLGDTGYIKTLDGTVHALNLTDADRL